MQQMYSSRLVFLYHCFSMAGLFFVFPWLVSALLQAHPYLKFTLQKFFDPKLISHMVVVILDSRIWQLLPWYEWDYSPLLPPKWWWPFIQNLWRENFQWYISLLGGSFQDNQTTEALVHGSRRSCSSSQDESTAREEVQICQGCWRSNEKGREWKELSLSSCITSLSALLSLSLSVCLSLSLSLCLSVSCLSVSLSLSLSLCLSLSLRVCLSVCLSVCLFLSLSQSLPLSLSVSVYWSLLPPPFSYSSSSSFIFQPLTVFFSFSFCIPSFVLVL